MMPDRTDDEPDTTMIVLTEDQVRHLRTLLLEDMHERAELLAKEAHSAHEAVEPNGEDARSAWRSCGMHESAALLDDIGWSAVGTA